MFVKSSQNVSGPSGPYMAHHPFPRAGGKPTACEGLDGNSDAGFPHEAGNGHIALSPHEIAREENANERGPRGQGLWDSPMGMPENPTLTVARKYLCNT